MNTRFNREIKLSRKCKKLMKLLNRRGAQTKTVGLAEVKAQPGLK